MKLPVFCYGTLRSPIVMKAITNQEFIVQEAVLSGYALYRICNAAYPGIIAENGKQVKGTLYFNIDEPVLQLLDEFEGEEYFRTVLPVKGLYNKTIKAYIYLFREEFRNRLSKNPWYYEKFLNEDLDIFLSGCA